MAGRVSPGDKLPFFRYDTPYSAQNRFRDLLAAQAPLVLVFMNNFGHPVTRTFAERYARTYRRLYSGGFALVAPAPTSWPAASAPARCLTRCCAMRTAFCTTFWTSPSAAAG